MSMSGGEEKLFQRTILQITTGFTEEVEFDLIKALREEPSIENVGRTFQLGRTFQVEEMP